MSTTSNIATLSAHAALHTERCAASRAARAAWDARYPHFCRACDGAGGTEYRFDPSPAGVGLSPGFMTEYEPCSCITERNVCPRCGGRWPGPRTYLVNYHLARWLDERVARSLYEADRAARGWLTDLLVRAAGPRLARLTRARLRNVIGYGGSALGLSWLAATLSEWLWLGLQDGDSEPACGWCGWNHGRNAGDVRPAHECHCVEAEVAAGRRCARCERIFTDQEPAIRANLFGVGRNEKIHLRCMLEGDQAEALPARPLTSLEELL